jgi:succinylglutamate desuccinylase
MLNAPNAFRQGKRFCDRTLCELFSSSFNWEPAFIYDNDNSPFPIETQKVFW